MAISHHLLGSLTQYQKQVACTDLPVSQCHVSACPSQMPSHFCTRPLISGSRVPLLHSNMRGKTCPLVQPVTKQHGTVLQACCMSLCQAVLPGCCCTRRQCSTSLKRVESTSLVDIATTDIPHLLRKAGCTCHPASACLPTKSQPVSAEEIHNAL